MANHNNHGVINVSLGEYSYPIFLMEEGIKRPEAIRGLIKSQQVLIVTNKTISKLYLKPLLESLSDKQCDTVILEDGEKYKNQKSLNDIYDALIRNKHHRDTTLIALGGGVVGDLTGFAASTYQRGVSFIQIPTTLLAQVDSSVGGKTAINLPGGKNLIGSFYQPSAVLIYIDVLNTLPEREFTAGMAEIVKYGLLAGGKFLNELSYMLQRGLSGSNSLELLNLVRECCKIKAEVVQKDEKEHSTRALLNLGHTFAHALEVQTDYTRWLHGEAVAIGLYCAGSLSYQLGYLDKEQLDDIESLLENAHLPHKIPSDIDLDKLYEKMFLDKKIKDNKLTFILIKKQGSCFISTDVSEEQIKKTLIDSSEGE